MTENNNTINNLNAQNQPKQDTKELKMKFLKSFVDSKDENGFRVLFDTLSSDRNKVKVPDLVNKQLSLFKNRSGNERFDKVNVKEIEFYELFRVVLEMGGAELESSRRELFNLYSNLYKHDTVPEFDATLNSAISKENTNTLKRLLSSESERDRYIKRQFPNQQISLKSKENIELLGFDVTVLDESERGTLQAYISDGTYSDALIAIVHKLKPADKRAILNRFFPVINLAEAEKLKIISGTEAENIKKDSIRRILLSKGIPQDKIDSISDDELDLIDKREILVKVEDLLVHNPRVDKAVERLLDDKKIKFLFKEVDKQVSENEENDKIDNLEAFKERLSDFPRIKGIGILKNETLGCYFHGTKKDEFGIEKKLYLEIVAFGENDLIVSEKTHPHGIIKSGEGIKQTIKYENLYNILSYFGEGQVYTKEELQDQISEGSIKAYENPEEIKTYDELVKQIDSIDEQGKSIKIEKGMVFGFKGDNPDQVAVGKISKIDKDGDKIEITSVGPALVMTFGEFFLNYKELEGKRMTTLTDDFSSVVESLKLNPDTEKKWKEVLWKNGRVVPKNQESNNDHPGINHFFKDKKALKIEKYNPNCVEVIIGELEEGSDKKKTIKDAKKSTMSYEIFYAYILKHKLEPYINNDDIKTIENLNPNKPGSSWKASKSFFGMQNIITIQAGWKQYIDSIKSTLKDNNDLQAAEFALSLGKTLPSAMRQDLQNRVEGVQKKKMNEKVDQLNGMTLGLGIDQVKKTLETKNAYQHEVEAALMYVLKKHGGLYPLKLYEYKGSYMWYEKLGGRVGDSMYQDYVRDCIRDNAQITEEGLIQKLFIQQTIPDSKYYPKRRSTIVGEMAGTWSGGRNDGIDAGEKEAGTLATLEGRRKLAFGKFKEGRHMFAIGAMKGLLDSGGSITERSMVPFVVMMSGISKKWHEDTAKKVEGLGGKHQLPLLTFAGNPQNVDLFERVAIKLAKQVSDDAAEKLEEIKKMKASGKSDADVMGKIEEFWKKHGGAMAPKLSTVDLNAVLLSNEDPDIKEYFEKTGEQGDGFSKENIENGVYEQDNALLIYAGGHKYLSRGLGPINRNGYQKDSGALVADGLLKLADKIKSFEHHTKDADKTEEGKRKLFIDLNRIVAKTFITRDINTVKDSAIYRDLDRLGFWLPKAEDKLMGIGVKEMDSSQYEEKFDAAYVEFKKGGKEDKINKSKKDTVIKIEDIMKVRTKERRQSRGRGYPRNYMINSDDEDEYWNEAA